MDEILDGLRSIHKKYRLAEGDVSSHTKSAQKITSEWQNLMSSESIGAEVRVSPENNERIDIVDYVRKEAYELKVSGNNTHHEFYKDLVKVLTYNEYQPQSKRLVRLNFISEEIGIKSLSNRLDAKFLKLLMTTHNLSIDLISL